jgi:hypothetical protein
MRRCGVVAVLVIGTLVAAAGTGISGTMASARSISGNVEPELRAIPPGTVGVVANGAPVGGVVAVMVENRSARSVTRIGIRATALDANGRAVARASSRQIVPEVLAPDALGLARVDFDDPQLPPDLTYRFKVKSRPARDSSTVALEPTEFGLSPPLPGPLGQTLDVTLRNPTQRRLRGPVHVAVMCFGAAARPVLLVTPTPSIDRIAAGASVSTTVELEELCPSYLVAATAVRQPR